MSNQAVTGLIIAGTGHRMDRLGGYNAHAEQKVLKVARYAIRELQPLKVISGMALGWDQAIAVAAIENNTPLICALPFKGQEKIWPQSSKDTYLEILECAVEIVHVDEIPEYGFKGVLVGVYHPAKLQLRNQWMVDNCELLCALWNGSSGGTKNCIDYARRKLRPFRNFWNEFNSEV